jgi:hypothetical protein
LITSTAITDDQREIIESQLKTRIANCTDELKVLTKKLEALAAEAAAKTPVLQTTAPPTRKGPLANWLVLYRPRSGKMLAGQFLLWYFLLIIAIAPNSIVRLWETGAYFSALSSTLLVLLWFLIMREWASCEHDFVMSGRKAIKLRTALFAPRVLFWQKCAFTVAIGNALFWVLKYFWDLWTYQSQPINLRYELSHYAPISASALTEQFLSNLFLNVLAIYATVRSLQIKGSDQSAAEPSAQAAAV